MRLPPVPSRVAAAGRCNRLRNQRYEGRRTVSRHVPCRVATALEFRHESGGDDALRATRGGRGPRRRAAPAAARRRAGQGALDHGQPHRLRLPRRQALHHPAVRRAAAPQAPGPRVRVRRSGGGRRGHGDPVPGRRLRVRLRRCAVRRPCGARLGRRGLATRHRPGRRLLRRGGRRHGGVALRPLRHPQGQGAQRRRRPGPRRDRRHRLGCGPAPEGDRSPGHGDQHDRSAGHGA